MVHQEQHVNATHRAVSCESIFHYLAHCECSVHYIAHNVYYLALCECSVHYLAQYVHYLAHSVLYLAHCVHYLAQCECSVHYTVSRSPHNACVPSRDSPRPAPDVTQPHAGGYNIEHRSGAQQTPCKRQKIWIQD